MRRALGGVALALTLLPLAAGCTGGSAGSATGTSGAGSAVATSAAAPGAAGSSGATTSGTVPGSKGPASTTAAGAGPPGTGATRLAVRRLPGQLDRPLSRMVTLATPGGGLELLGGLLNGDHSSNQVRSVALPTGTVTRTGTLSVGVHDSAGALVGTQAYVYAGGAAHEVATIQVGVPGGPSKQVGTLPQPRSDLAVAVVGSTVVVVGGYDGAHTLADVLVSQDGVHFRVLTQLPVPVRYPAVLVSGRSVLVYGGDVARKPVDAIQRIDLDTAKAAVVGHLPRALSHEAAYRLGAVSWLVGGTTSSGATAAILRSTDGVAFTAAGALPGPVSDAGAAVVGGVGYLVGGETATSRTSTILALTPG